MANKSARDKCFEDAVNALNDTLPDDQKINIQHQQPWGQVDGKWRPLGMGERLWNWITDKTIPYRVPDWTITENGKPIAGDNKFSGDKYNENRVGRSGKTQREDQNQMNEDQHPGNNDYQDLNLNPETCKCDGNPQRQQVQVTVPYGVMVPGVSPAPGSLPSTVPEMPELPSFGGFGLPEFVIP
jgi:hypothetical protein